MKAEDLIKVIRKLIREEVKKVVSEEVNKSMVKLLAEVVSSKNSGQIIPEANPVKEEASPKIFSRNPLLNEALNSTTSAVKKTDPSSRVSLSEMFSKVGEHEQVITEPRSSEIKLDTSSNIGMLKSIVNKEPVGQQTSVLDNAASTPLAGVFKKDFRALMRKMDEKKTTGSSGFFAGSIPMTPQVGGYEQ